MRRAMPYPCSGPSVSSVLSTISASVPCHTSVLCPMFSTPMGTPFHALWDGNTAPQDAEFHLGGNGYDEVGLVAPARAHLTGRGRTRAAPWVARSAQANG